MILASVEFMGCSCGCGEEAILHLEGSAWRGSSQASTYPDGHWTCNEGDCHRARHVAQIACGRVPRSNPAAPWFTRCSQSRMCVPEHCGICLENAAPFTLWPS